jgi:hypothetical protein
VHKGLTDRLEEIVGINTGSGTTTHSPAPFGAGSATSGVVESTPAGGATPKAQTPAEKAVDGDDFKDF